METETENHKCNACGHDILNPPYVRFQQLRYHEECYEAAIGEDHQE